MGVLTVVLERVTNLVDSDRLGRSDPFLKFHLEKDKLLFDKNFGTKKSSKKKNELNPEYNEVFVFEDVDSLQNMKLNVTILDNDIGLDDKIGELTVDLEEQALTDAPKSIQFAVQCKSGMPTVHLKLSFIGT
jgi:Ca2+-dependent lipid-binding protein